jgi:hypothetical protein
MRQPTIQRFTMITMFALAACGGNPPTPAPAANAGPAPQAPASTTGGEARDVTKIDVCALLPVAEVADALLASPGDRPPNGHSYPGAESECWYEVVRSTGRTIETVGVFLYPPESFAGLQEDGAIEFPGLGDAAFLSPRTDIATVIAVKQGVATVDARAADADHARKIAEIVLAKLEQR